MAGSPVKAEIFKLLKQKRLERLKSLKPPKVEAQPEESPEESPEETMAALEAMLGTE